MIKEPLKPEGLYNPDNEHDNCGIGFIAHIKGKVSHDIVEKGFEILRNMDHRGAKGSDNTSGDGAGIMVGIPDKYFRKTLKIALPHKGLYGTGLLFLPPDEKESEACLKILKNIVAEEKLELFFTRAVPVNSGVLGEIAKSTEPFIKQVFITGKMEQDQLEQKLYIIRKRAEHAVYNSNIPGKHYYYHTGLSTQTMIYKGMFTPFQLREYFPDLQSLDFESSFGLVHSRFSTNTFPTWDLAQPFRIIAHNGEINTIKGNRLWTHARESLLESGIFGESLKKILPVLEPNKSDSASFDNVLEFLHLTGRSIPHSLCMMIPESFNEKNPIPSSLKAFYEYHSTLMEPWDGPASMIFSDGRYIGGTLDRNGLRPSRYIVTHDDLIIMSSEVGVLSLPAENIKEKSRLRPGKILLVDTRLGTIIPDKEVKDELSHRNPYSMWLKENRLMMKDIKVKKRVPSLIEDYETFTNVFSYSKEDRDFIIKSMSVSGNEPVSSMGNDTPIAIFSKKPQRLFNYFKQIFAQVTNPPIDPIREGLVMSLTNYIGSLNSNILSESPEHCKLIKFNEPIITNTDLGKIKDLKDEMFSHKIIPAVFNVKKGFEGFIKAFEKMLSEAESAVDDKKNFIVISDKYVNQEQAPFPILLAVGAIHHHLIRKKKRMQIGIIVETGEAREINHYALLIGYGASVINPYLAFATIKELTETKKITLPYKKARENYIKAINKGLLKIISKMGISTIRSYHGSQVFEAIGLDNNIVKEHFTGTFSPINGIGFRDIYRTYLGFHNMVFHPNPHEVPWKNDIKGVYSWRKNGEAHAWNPESVALLQWAARSGDYSRYKKYSEEVEKFNRKPNFIRGCFILKKNPISLDSVESEEAIMKRFVTGAMSFGSISKEAHETLAIAMNTVGGRSNTGEGGEDINRFDTIKQSAIKQVASGRFGVTSNYLTHAEEIQIKIAQGAKPGEGGQLPGYKVNEVIAKTRKSTPGITLISPPPHHDIYSIEDLAQLIYDLKVAHPGAIISVKLVSEEGVGTIAAGVAKAHADIIIISGGEGGTGASPVSSIKHAGLPVELGLAEVQQTLVKNNLRGRVKIQTDGQLKNGYDVVKMACLGAEEFGFATSALISLGCVMMRKCHLNTCPAGIATQDKKLRQRFKGKPEDVITFFRFLAKEIGEILAETGYTKLEDVVGRTELLLEDKTIKTGKLSSLDFSSILFRPKESEMFPIRNNIEQKTNIISNHLDHVLIEKTEKALEAGEKVWVFQSIANTDRTVGAMLSGEISIRYGEEGLPENSIHATFVGSAGQSFGAFLAKGITFRLEGDANDYIGKGLSGGKIIVVPPSGSTFKPEENIIIGNSTYYGATSGETYIHGIAGERFCVRNSGITAVVEGVGDHGCEYMTGGIVVVLGKTGRNFAAGMSGGIAYVLDEDGDFDYYCNPGQVDLTPVEDKSDINTLQNLIHKHWLLTQSLLATKILTRWEAYINKFVKVIPFEYKKVEQEKKLKELEKKLRMAEDFPRIHE